MFWYEDICLFVVVFPAGWGWDGQALDRRIGVFVPDKNPASVWILWRHPFLSLSSHVECCSSSSREQLPHAVSIVQFLSKHFVEWLILSSLKILKYIQIHKHSYFKTCEKRKKILLNVRKKYVQDYLNDTKSFTIHANYLKMFLVSRFSSPCWAAGGSCLPWLFPCSCGGGTAYDGCGHDWLPVWGGALHQLCWSIPTTCWCAVWNLQHFGYSARLCGSHSDWCDYQQCKSLCHCQHSGYCTTFCGPQCEWCDHLQCKSFIVTNTLAAVSGFVAWSL